MTSCFLKKIICELVSTSTACSIRLTVKIIPQSIETIKYIYMSIYCIYKENFCSYMVVKNATILDFGLTLFYFRCLL